MNFMQYLLFAVSMAFGIVFITAGVAFNINPRACDEFEWHGVIGIATLVISIGVLSVCLAVHVCPFRESQTQPVAKPAHLT